MASLLDLTMADRLRAQAETLLRRVSELTREADELRAEAIALRTDADMLEVEPVQVRRPVLTAVHNDTTFQERVCDALGHSEGMNAVALAEHVNASPARVRQALSRLEDAGVVVRTGATRHTRWYLAGEPDPEPVRTGSAVLRVFTKATPERELQDRKVAWTTESPRG